MPILNMEPLCARHGMAMITATTEQQRKTQENIITRGLGVLVENGIYAMALYFSTCDTTHGPRILTRHLRSLWQEEGIGIIADDVAGNMNAMLEAIRGLTENLPRLILAKKLAEQTLTFARYHAKAVVNIRNTTNEA